MHNVPLLPVAATMPPSRPPPPPPHAPGPWQAKVYQSYELCCGDGTGMGDGITPLQSAFDMAEADRYVELEVRRAIISSLPSWQLLPVAATVAIGRLVFFPPDLTAQAQAQFTLFFVSHATLLYLPVEHLPLPCAEVTELHAARSHAPVRRPDDAAFVSIPGSLPCSGVGRAVVWKRQRH